MPNNSCMNEVTDAVDRDCIQLIDFRVRVRGAMFCVVLCTRRFPACTLRGVIFFSSAPRKPAYRNPHVVLIGANQPITVATLQSHRTDTLSAHSVVHRTFRVEGMQHRSPLPFSLHCTSQTIPPREFPCADGHRRDHKTTAYEGWNVIHT
ncbi:hypothetical protein PLICRDRAFT_47520 [Plicaturopsis crispa FD-325 SS-3]|uniref:Unplaced genomic scaffold PLICRscaffold_219, whole genome shotgun sequence n=1 Tax=Plicaturopsis crispa FD-325 SS-3 TaxID=944288 RepID=A0A0C9T0P7_PLICR|nr:hypothetical protein PLICRDRAFT_47520 [Plicaturopsis crispa FD-325 SS-3]